MNAVLRYLSHIGVIVLVSLTIAGCSPFSSSQPPVSMEEARTILSNDGFRIVVIGMTLTRPVDERTCYGICKDTKGNEYAYRIDIHTKTPRTIRLGVNGELTYEEMERRLLKQRQKLTDIQTNLVLTLGRTDVLYWQYEGNTWNLQGEPYNDTNP